MDITMQHLALRPGPQRVLRAFRPEPDDMGRRLGEVDVTGRAHEVPFEPITAHAEVRITDDDATAKAVMNEIRRARNADVTLGQVIPGLLWEPSFHGGPQEQREVSEDLKQGVAEIDAGTAELVSGDDIFDHPDPPGCAALFDELGGRRQGAVSGPHGSPVPQRFPGRRALSIPR